MISVPKSILDYVRLVEEGTPFSYSNIGGDGEFLTITGWDGTNSDGRTSTPEKARALARVLLEPRLTLHGYNPGHLKSDKEAGAQAWLRKHGINVPHRPQLTDPDFGKSKINVRWVHKEIISSANVNGKLAGFLAALRDRPLLVVGMEGITRGFLNTALKAQDSVLFPLAMGWDQMGAIRDQVHKALDALPPDTVVTWGLGYLSKVLTWELALERPELTQIDVGACWDAYCGVCRRHGYRKPAWKEAMRKNLAP